MQHLTALLAAPDHLVVTATLQAFVALVRKTHIASIRYPGGPEQNSRLLALAQGWGGKEQVTPCCHSSHPSERYDGSLGQLRMVWYARCLLTAVWPLQGLGLVECAHDDESGIREVSCCWWKFEYCFFCGACLMVSSVLTGSSLGNSTPS